MGSLIQLCPFQISKLLVWKLNPIIPIFGFLGLPGVFQDGILSCLIAGVTFLPILSSKIW
jgi:hypothetical protein